MSRPALSDLVPLPGPFTFRVVADHHDALTEECVTIVRTAVGRAPTEVITQPSSGGKYRAVRLTVHIEAAGEIEAAYAAFQGLAGLRYLL